MVAVAYMLTQAAWAKLGTIAAGRAGSVLSACLDQSETNAVSVLLTAPHKVTYI